MDRRRFLMLGAASALAGCGRLGSLGLPITVYLPGMAEGHLLRDGHPFPPPSGTITVDTVVVGSGIAGLTAAWKLQKEGHRDVLLLDGPEFAGNASAGHFGDLRYPRGAHYLPLPTRESSHIREMLADFRLALRDVDGDRPYYDEATLLHAPESRIHNGQRWEDGILPTHALPHEDAAQQARFFAQMESLKHAVGADGRKVFSIPLALSSQDPAWTRLDRQSFRQWLNEHGYTAPTLHWYADYACRDDYGAPADRVSAWAGLHYFASRTGKAANADDDAVLTWPQGLNALAEKLAVGTRRQSGMALRIVEQRNGVIVTCLAAEHKRTFTIQARRAICAMPLHVAAHVVEGFSAFGLTEMPPHAPWLVSSFLLDGFPPERGDAPLSWDNVVYQGRGLGYVVATHQFIRAARPERTVFTAYQALSYRSPVEVRRWLEHATAEDLYAEASCDLEPIYGWRLRKHAVALEITARGHAMATPYPGFLSNRGLATLREKNGPLLFAHTDLSSLSIFEEAAWWGYQAAQKILAG